MKKLFALLTALTLLLSLAACGSSNDTPPSSNPPSVTAPSTPEEGSSAQEPEAPSTEEDAPVQDDTAGQPDADAKPDAPASGTGSTGSTTNKPAGGTSSGSGTTSKPSGGTTVKPETKPETPAPAPAEKSLSDLMETILSGVDAPGYSTTTLTAELFPAFLFIDQPTGAEAVSADAMIGSVAHSVVLMRLSAGADVAAVAKQVKDKADPRKWICVEAEKVEVKTNGNLVLLVMSDTATTDAITANFAALSA